MTQSRYRSSIFARLGACYFLIIIVVIRHETTAAARWALLLIIRTLFNDAITIAVWTGFGFHLCLPVDIFASLIRQPHAMHPGASPAFRCGALERYVIESTVPRRSRHERTSIDPQA
jgi:hypothetical protein